MRIAQDAVGCYGAPFVSKFLWHSMDKNRFDIYKIDSMFTKIDSIFNSQKSTRFLTHKNRLDF